nr:MAG TPA_asm: hypothetical protein [Caudoviricetes sp.]
MSKWTDIRDGVLEALDVDTVTENLKQQMTASLLSEGIPALEAVAAKFISQIQAEAGKENGWNKVRDSIVLPMVINVGLWLVKTVLNKTTVEKN